MAQSISVKASRTGPPRRCGRIPSTRTFSSRRPRGRSVSNISAGISFEAAPVEVLLGGGALIATTAGFLIVEAIKAAKQQTKSSESRTNIAPDAAAPLPRENAVVVFGASGRTGLQVVDELLKAGRTVIAAVRDASRAREAFSLQGISEGRQNSGGRGILFIEPGIDVTNPATLTSAIFKGASQIVCCLGPVFGKLPDGKMGYLDGMTSEKVDAGGVAAIAAAAVQFLPRSRRTDTTEILAMRSADEVAVWQRLDDVIMGGNSSSEVSPAEDGSGAVWRGSLVTEGGGFCGARTQPRSMDLSAYDGIVLRVKTDRGQTIKLNIKTDAFSEPEDTYQASVETLDNGEWSTVYIPWHEFYAVKKAKVVSNAPPLDPSTIKQFGLIYSRFSYNGFPNERYVPGNFEFQFEGGIRGFKAPKPQILLVSSAAVERNARIGDDAEARKQDIPIVQLNPGGVLNHKYAGEAAVRGSGLAYCVIRPTGMSDEAAAAGPALLEVSQGDRISGKVARSEVAAVVVNALGLPSAANKTVEVRRQEAVDAQNRAMTPRDYLRMFLEAVPDRKRAEIGLEPFPKVVAPPPPVTEERKKEILADPRVQEVQNRAAGGRVRTEEESGAAQNVTVVDDGRKEVSPGKKVSSDDKGSNGIPAPKKEVGITPDNVAEVREWIRKWRAKSLEKQLPRGVAAGKESKHG